MIIFTENINDKGTRGRNEKQFLGWEAEISFDDSIDSLKQHCCSSSSQNDEITGSGQAHKSGKRHFIAFNSILSHPSKVSTWKVSRIGNAEAMAAEQGWPRLHASAVQLQQVTTLFLFIGRISHALTASLGSDLWSLNHKMKYPAEQAAGVLSEISLVCWRKWTKKRIC